MFQWTGQGLLGNRIIRHLLFWISIIVFFSVLYGSFNDDYWRQFEIQLISLPSKIIPTYITLYILMPYFLLKARYSEFLIWLLLTLIMAGMIQWVISFYVEQPLYYPGENWGPFLNFAKVIKTVVYIYPYVLVAFVIKFLKHWYSEQKENQELLKDKLEAELKFLKTQLQPHFLFNTLNNLYALTLKKSDAAPEMVLKLSDLMDYMLYECDADRVPLDREIQFVKNYFEIEKLRYGKRLKENFIVEGETRGKRIAPMIFLPFLENAFKHGVSQEVDEATISFHLKVGQENIAVEINNSISSESDTSSTKNNGIGLKNVKRRLELQYGKDNYTLNSERNNSFFSVKLSLNNA